MIPTSINMSSTQRAYPSVPIVFGAERKSPRKDAKAKDKGIPAPNILGIVNRTEQAIDRIANTTCAKARKAKAKSSKNLVEKLRDALQGLILKLQHLETENIRDARTGLFNIRHFNQQFPLLFEKAKADKKPLSIIAFDLDSFKNVNDVDGHPTGDRVLESVGRVAKNVCRVSDLAFRTGGEEFMIVLPGAPEKSAVRIAKRLLKEIPAITQSLRQQGQQRREADTLQTLADRRDISASIGVMTVDFAKETLDEPQTAIDMADKASYESKKSGKNRLYTINAGADSVRNGQMIFRFQTEGPTLLSEGHKFLMGA